MNLDEILEALRGAEETSGYADSIAQIFADTRAGGESALAEANAALEAANAEIQRLQAENYKLMTSLGSSTDPAPADGEAEEEPGEENAPVEDVTEYIEEED